MRPATILALFVGAAVAAPTLTAPVKREAEANTDLMISSRDLAAASQDLHARQLDFGLILQFLPIILEGVANGTIPISFVIELLGNLIKGNVQTDLPIGLIIDLAVTLIKLIEGQTSKASLKTVFAVVGDVQKSNLSAADLGNLINTIKGLIAGGGVDLAGIIALISGLIN